MNSPPAKRSCAPEGACSSAAVISVTCAQKQEFCGDKNWDFMGVYGDFMGFYGNLQDFMVI